MALGMGRAGIAPKDFWAMTPRELMAVLDGAGLVVPPRQAPQRAVLEALMARFPDMKE
ncbi:putative phage protein (TIGR02216 family) [Rhodoligotrophos appendicifer]